jgi:hypothetical protein
MPGRELPFGPDGEYVDPDTGKTFSAYVNAEIDGTTSKRYQYEAAVVLRRNGVQDPPARYASSLIRDDGDAPPLLWEDSDLEAAIAAADEAHVSAGRFHEDVSAFDWAMVWSVVNVEEIIEYGIALRMMVDGFPIDDFPGFEIVGGVVAERVFEQSPS